jgi:peptidoglycan DL-endopeptidase CwlO
LRTEDEKKPGAKTQLRSFLVTAITAALRTHVVNHDADITHTMIYLCREKATNRRIIVGASDGRTYKGHARFGVSVFDFKVGRARLKNDNEAGPMFVG